MSRTRLHVVSWRDLDHPEAGGSELHIDALATRWAAAGIDVTLRTGAVPGAPPELRRHGYRVVRRGGRLTGLVRTPVSEALRRQGPRDALVEVWHGFNFLSPLWSRGPTVGIAHHVHGEQFRWVLPAPAANVARALEAHVYPRLYRRTPLVTLSPSTRDELLALGHRPEQVTVVQPGVDPRFRPGGARSSRPLVVTVGRLVSHKRVDLLVEALAPLRDRHPGLELLVVGSGPDRERLAAVVPPWVDLAGRLPDDELVDAYRRAWVVASASVAEGWNMTLSEAGACATPAVASRIAGHADAVTDGETGYLVDDRDGFTAAFDRLLGDSALRERLGQAARRHAEACDWDRAAATVLELLGCAPGDPVRP